MSQSILAQPQPIKKSILKRTWRLDSLLYLALIFALASSLKHVAYSFSTVSGGSLWAGYVSAIAIDLGLLALAGGINKRKREGRPSWPLWAGVLFFSLISIYANWIYGLVHLEALPVEMLPENELALWLIALRPVLLAGVLPILVIYLSEIVSSNYEQAREQAHKAEQEAQRAAHREAKRVERLKLQALSKSAQSSSQSANEQGQKPPNEQSKAERLAHLDNANLSRQERKAKNMDAALELYLEGATHSEVAEALDLSISTVKRYKAELNGRLLEAQNG